jgi:hypothetical protein
LLKTEKGAFGIFYPDEVSGICLHFIRSFPHITAKKVGVTTFHKNMTVFAEHGKKSEKLLLYVLSSHVCPSYCEIKAHQLRILHNFARIKIERS